MHQEKQRLESDAQAKVDKEVRLMREVLQAEYEFKVKQLEANAERVEKEKLEELQQK